MKKSVFALIPALVFGCALTTLTLNTGCGGDKVQKVEGKVDRPTKEPEFGTPPLKTID